MNRLVFQLFLPLLLICPCWCPAEDPKPKNNDAPIEKAVATALEAARKGDWQTQAELIHPDDLQVYKNMWVPVIQAAAKKGPAEQAEILSLFEKAADAKTLLALKPHEFYLSSMKGLNSKFPQLKDMVAASDSQIIGTVREGEDLAHVVIRPRIKGTEINKIEVVTLSRSGTEWKSKLPAAVQVLAETFKRTFDSGTVKANAVQDDVQPEK